MKNKLLLSVATCGLMAFSNANAQVTTSFSSLKAAVNSTATTKEYTLTGNESVSSALGIMGGTSLTIEGDGNSIIASSVSGIITRSYQTLNINNVDNITGFYGENATVIDNYGTLNITSSNFSNNKATSYGGVIRSTYNSTLNITDSKFDNNSAGVGSAGISSLGTTTIINSFFTNNTANAIGSVGSLTIQGSTFENNTYTGNDGGAIQSKEDTSVSVTGEKIVIEDYVSGTSSIKTTFTKNTANNGGAIWNSIVNAGSSIDATFTSNVAKNYGGAIYNTGSINIKSATSFTSNNSFSNGGAIYNDSPVGAFNIDASFNSNYSQFGQGGAVYNAASSTINSISGSFTSNYIGSSTATFGGALYNGGNINTLSASFTSNYANGNNSKGGAVYNAGVVDTLSGTYTTNGIKVDGTSSTVVTAYGGAIYNAGTINEISSGTVFTGNRVSLSTAAAQGGAIYNAVGATIKKIDATFNNNYVSGFSGDMGGAIYNAGTIESLSGDFTSNGNAGLTNNGGAIYNIGTLNIDGGLYTLNAVEEDGKGGAIYNSGTMEITDASFSNNSAGTGGLGGAIYNEGTLSIFASTAKVLIANNSVGTVDNQGIYNTSILNLNASGTYTITMNDEITGNGSGTININNEASGNVIINADINDNTLHFINGTLSLGIYNGAGVTLDSLYAKQEYSDTRVPSEYRKINTIDGFITNYTITNDMELFKSNLAIDIDLRNDTADNFTVNGNLSANTGVVLLNVTDYEISIDPTENNGKVTIFVGEASNENLSLLEGEINIFDSKKQIKLVQDEADNGAYKYTITGAPTDFNINDAMAFDASHTQYDMIKAPEGLGNETLTSHTLGYFDNIAGKEVGKDMVVNGYDKDSGGFTLTGVPDASTGDEAKITLESESTYYSVNVNYADVNFYMQCNGNNTITFDTLGTFTSTTLGSDFSSDNINNKLILSGAGSYTLDGSVSSLTLNANADTTITGTITDSIVNAKSILTTTQAISNSTINTETKLVAQSTITNSTITTSGEVIRNNYDNGVTYNLNEDGTLSYANLDYLYKEGTTTTLNSINFAGGELLSIQNNEVNDIKLNTLSITKDSDISLDVDLANKTMDTFSADTIIASANLNVEKLILLSDAVDDVTTINFTDNATLAANTSYSGMASIAYSPIYQYQVTYDKMMGDFTFSKGNSINSYNPAVFTSEVAKDAMTLATFDIFDKVLMNADSLDFQPSLLGMSSGDTPKYSKPWFKTFGSNEDLNFSIYDIDNQTYGGILGVDSAVQVKDGWHGINSAYVAYVGSTQEYNDVNINQNGAIVGLRTMQEKNNWFMGTTISLGATFVDGSNIYGDEEFWMYSAGISHKLGKKIDLYCKQYILQPSITMSYLHTYTTGYDSASGLKVDSNSLNVFQFKPELKLIAILDNHIRPYLAVSYNWNTFSNPDLTINTVLLPDLEIDPYTEYKFGLSSDINNKISGYAEFSLTSGSKEGFGAQIGLKWNF